MQSVPGEDRRPNQWVSWLRGRGPPGQVALPLMTLTAPPSTLGRLSPPKSLGHERALALCEALPARKHTSSAALRFRLPLPALTPLCPAYLPLCHSAQAVLPKDPRGLESDWRVPPGSGTPGAPARPCSARTCPRPTPRQTPSLAECVIPTCGEPDLTESPPASPPARAGCVPRRGAGEAGAEACPSRKPELWACRASVHRGATTLHPVPAPAPEGDPPRPFPPPAILV